MFTVYLHNSVGGELERKTRETIEEALSEYAREGCLSGGDTLKIYDHQDEDDDEEPQDHRDREIDSQGYSL